MNILGLVFVGADPSACLLKDGSIAGMIEEERLIRIKHATDYFPTEAVKFCLKKGEIDISEVDYIAYPWDAQKFDTGIQRQSHMKNFYDSLNKKYIKDSRTLKWEQLQIDTFNTHAMTNKIIKSLKKIYPTATKFPRSIYVAP